MARPVRFRVVEPEDGTLLPVVLARRLPDLDLAAAKELVRSGAVYLGHLRVRLTTTRVVTGERITVYPAALDKAELPLQTVRFVHRDPSFVVLDKPAGVPVAQTRDSSRGTLAEALRRVLVDEGVVRPYVGVVHRLDQGASGLVLFTIRSASAALVELPHGRVRVANDGEPRARAAATEMRRLDPEHAQVDGQPAALVEATLETGRTHQIRVHAQTLGYPVLGDRKYGDRDDDEPSRLYLHADRLCFSHPSTGESIDLRAPRPDWARATSDDETVEPAEPVSS